MAQLAIEDLNFRYPSASCDSLRHVSVQLERGEYVLLCGRSGSGKSTLLRHLKTVLTPYGKRSGRILFNGQLLETVSPRDQAARIGFVMQNPDDQIVTDKVWHELAFGLENLGCEEQSMRLRIGEMASFFGIQDWFEREVSTLSGGQKQLLNLAAIMAMQPEILILDEPTSQLDPIAAADFLNTLRKINLELGTTILITEHRTEDIFPAADRVVVMEAGRICADDTPRKVGQMLYQTQNVLFQALPTPVRVFYESGAAGECPLTIREGRRWLSEAFPSGTVRIPALPRTEAPLCAAAAVELKDVWFRYERNSPDILRGVSMRVPTGCIYAIVGGNGTGKSTTLKALCNICRPYRGKVTLFGKESRYYSGKERFSGCLTMLPQDPKSLLVHQTVQQELEEMSQDAAAAARCAQLCEIVPLLNSHPQDLSGGEQQRVALAKVLLTQPKLLLLDEPTKALDAAFKQKFAQILRKLKQQGTTVIMVSHDVEFCAEHADLVSIFFNGQLLATDRPRRFFGMNSFYTTAANRMSRCVFNEAVTADDVIALCRRNWEAGV